MAIDKGEPPLNTTVEVTVELLDVNDSPPRIINTVFTTAVEVCLCLLSLFFLKFGFWAAYKYSRVAMLSFVLLYILVYEIGKGEYKNLTVVYIYIYIYIYTKHSPS